MQSRFIVCVCLLAMFLEEEPCVWSYLRNRYEFPPLNFSFCAHWLDLKLDLNCLFAVDRRAGAVPTQ